MVNGDRLRLIVQGVLALGVIGAAVVLALDGAIKEGTVAALLGGALGAIGTGTVSARQTPHPDPGIGDRRTDMPPTPPETGE